MDAGDTVWWDPGGTWNPVGGCKPVSTECANCYAAIQAGTLHQSAGAKREVRLLYDGVVDKRAGRHWFNGKPIPSYRGGTLPGIFRWIGRARIIRCSATASPR